ncbi:hypothetical protein [Leptothoe kymatousa]|uniref:Uncharacterized protein n=1 Tax=Leptothoe kymatousa TAU-MAC 1615 TaxID=2364775 RepID=A0ABS5Y1Q4_9CYAN|nr:hypothetical protein [Leptothoe kymatousa]MBT9311753.1 hypothetical protein [Leptothoe kymatousa TAU-MAC 1615]
MTRVSDLAQIQEVELSQRILEMAKAGVYRESLFDAFSGVASKRQVRAAIATAKQFGLRSNPALRDTDLGTYYHIDPKHYDSFQTLLEAAISPISSDDVATRLRKLTEIVQTLVRISSGVALSLLMAGSLCVLNGKLILAATIWSAALAVSLVWMLQKLMVGSFLE